MKRKSLLSVIGVILLFLGSITSCGPSKAEREEAARRDSIRIADSIAQAEEEARLAAIEAARQDSLARIEKFKQSIPPFREIYLHFAMGKQNKYQKKVNLKKLGFTEKTTTSGKFYWDGNEDMEVEFFTTTYRLELDSKHYCTIECKESYECMWYTFRIVGFPDLIDDYRNQASKLENSSEFKEYSIDPWIFIYSDKIVWGDGV